MNYLAAIEVFNFISHSGGKIEPRRSRQIVTTMSEYQDKHHGTCSYCNTTTSVSLFDSKYDFPTDEYEDIYLCERCFQEEEEKENNEVKECYEQTKTSVHLCKSCGLEEPMYPEYWDSGDECGIYCVDCYWEEDSKRKKARRAWLHSNPEALQAYRDHVCQVLGLPSLSKEQPAKIETNDAK